MNAKHKTSEDARLFIDAVAAKQGWAVNPDAGFVNQLAVGLAANYNRFGYYLCPCRDGDGERSADDDIICPCDYARPDQAEYGHCLCGLFLSPEFAESGQQPASIPERREGGL